MESHQDILARLDALCTELVEHAFALDRAGNLSAGDIVMATAVRVAELRQEISTPGRALSERDDEQVASLCPR